MEGFMKLLPTIIGAGSQLASTLINHGQGGWQQPSMGTPPFIDPRQAGGKSPFSGMNPDLIRQIVSQNNNNEGLASLGGFTEGNGVPLSDTEQQIPQ